MGEPPFSPEERALVDSLTTPARVQRYLSGLAYNPEDTLRSFRGVVRTGKAHCIEGALTAATILNEHGYPPMLLDLESQDGQDHVVFLFRKRGRFGAVGASRFPGLHGRKPVYPTVRQLVLSYYDPYIDETGRITAYGVFDLRDYPGDDDWRFPEEDAWGVQDWLLAEEHTPLSTSDARYERVRRRYCRYKRKHGKEPTYYRTVQNWLQ